VVPGPAVVKSDGGRDLRQAVPSLHRNDRVSAAPRLPEVNSLNVSVWVWIATLVALIALLAVDLLIVGRRPHEPSMREATTWVGFYVGLARRMHVEVSIPTRRCRHHEVT